MHRHVKSYLGRFSLWPMWLVLHWCDLGEQTNAFRTLSQSLGVPTQKQTCIMWSSLLTLWGTTSPFLCAVLFDISPEGAWCFQCLQGLTTLYFVGVVSSHLLSVRTFLVWFELLFTTAAWISLCLWIPWPMFVVKYVFSKVFFSYLSQGVFCGEILMFKFAVWLHVMFSSQNHFFQYTEILKFAKHPHLSLHLYCLCGACFLCAKFFRDQISRRMKTCVPSQAYHSAVTLHSYLCLVAQIYNLSHTGGRSRKRDTSRFSRAQEDAQGHQKQLSETLFQNKTEKHINTNINIKPYSSVVDPLPSISGIVGSIPDVTKYI